MFLFVHIVAVALLFHDVASILYICIFNIKYPWSGLAKQPSKTCSNCWNTYCPSCSVLLKKLCRALLDYLFIIFFPYGSFPSGAN